MRIITGDECGILKESIPELSRTNKDDVKEAQPSVNMGVSRMGDTGDAELQMNRTRGIVDLAFCQIDSSHEDDAGAGSLNFCALRADGSLEQWEGFAPYKSKEDRICGGTYKLAHTLSNVFDAQDDVDVDMKVKDEYKGRPISMCSANQYQTFSSDSDLNKNIVACCSSMGLVSVVNTNAIEKGVVARYDAYSKGKSSEPTKISYTRGQFLNRDIATTMAMSADSQKIVIGGRERAATMIDVETGKNLWKVRMTLC